MQSSFTKTMNTPNCLTKVQQDWCQRNLMALQTSLRETETAMLSRTDTVADPLLSSPNLANLRGYMRWAILPRIIENHISVGRYPGISGKWTSMGGVSIFEMEGDFTTITAFHLKHEDEVPRESVFRKNKRRLNAGPQLQLGLSDEPADDGAQEKARVHLTLVYGGREQEFAYLRAYFDEDNRSYYHKLSANIMTMPVLLDAMETELVEEPQIELGLKLKTGHFDKAGA